MNVPNVMDISFASHNRKGIMATSQWVKYGAVFGAGALAVAGVWGVVGLVSGPDSTPATTTAAPADATSAEVTPIGNLQRNTLVTIQGSVESVLDEDEFVLGDATGSVKVWTGGVIIPVMAGETLTVRGLVDDDLLMEVYAQEITREGGEQLSVTRDSGESEPATDTATESTSQPNQQVSDGQVTAIGNLQRNSFVTIQGSVERVSDEDEFFLQDATGSVKVWTQGAFFTVEPGEQVTVQGFVDEDLLLEVYAQQITKENGDVITIGGYE